METEQSKMNPVVLTLIDTESNSQKTSRPHKIRMNGMEATMRRMGFVVQQGTEQVNGDSRACVGVSVNQCGSLGLEMQTILIPPQGECTLNAPYGKEAAVYIISGAAEHHFEARETVTTAAGDFVYMAPGVVAHTINRSETEPALLIVAQNRVHYAGRAVVVA
jgi:uncharacterized RmlC-like cupin family protein